MPPLILEPITARRVQLVGLDVDGVLTDAGVYIGRAGDGAVELKRFDIQDRVGIRMLRDAGLDVVIVSGRVSEATTIFAAEMGIEDVVQDDRARKLPAFEAILERKGIRFEHAAFVGDDLPDLPLLRRVGLPVAVGNAVPEVLDTTQYVTAKTGGRGAVREFAEALLRARGEWDAVVENYLADRGDPSPRMSGTYAKS